MRIKAVDDLFGFSEAASVQPSGAVPREMIPGITWDHRAEAMYQDAVKELRNSFEGKWSKPKFAADVDREARWTVELWLHRRFLKDRVMDAMSVPDDRAKIALVADWRRMYGNPRTEYLIKVLRTPALKSIVMSFEAEKSR